VANAGRFERLVLPSRPFREFMDEHELLLRAGRRAVSVGVVADLAVSYGVGESASAPYLERVRADGVATVRRSSGGSGILHAPGDLVWAVVIPRDDPLVGSDFVRAYDRYGAGLVHWLAAGGVESSWECPPDLSTEYCPLGARGMVLETKRGVLAAGAQHLTRSALLHHGTLPSTLDRPRIGKWFRFRGPGAEDRLTSLDELRYRDPPGALSRSVADALADGLEGPSS
jgi:lipoate-protein ligase A